MSNSAVQSVKMQPPIFYRILLPYSHTVFLCRILLPYSLRKKSLFTKSQCFHWSVPDSRIWKLVSASLLPTTFHHAARWAESLDSYNKDFSSKKLFSKKEILWRRSVSSFRAHHVQNRFPWNSLQYSSIGLFNEVVLWKREKLRVFPVCKLQVE